MVIGAAALLLPSALARPAAGISFISYLETLSPGTMAYTLTNQGSTHIKLAALRPGDFTIAGPVKTSVTSGPAASCSLGGDPVTLRCEGFDLAKNATLAVRFGVSGTPHTANQAVTDGSEPSDTAFFPVQAQKAAPRGTVSFKRLARKRLQVTIRNTGYVAFREIVLNVPKGTRLLSFRVPKRRALFGSAAPPCPTANAVTPGRTVFICHLPYGYEEIDNALAAILVGPSGLPVSFKSVIVNATTADGQPAALSKG